MTREEMLREALVLLRNAMTLIKGAAGTKGSTPVTRLRHAIKSTEGALAAAMRKPRDDALVLAKLKANKLALIKKRDQLRAAIKRDRLEIKRREKAISD
jgi:hypothetical protein